MMRNFRPIPFLLLVALVLALAGGLRHHQSNAFSSKMIGKSAGEFILPLRGGGEFRNADLQGKVTVLNIFASWCESCVAEHEVLMQLQQKGVAIVGVAWRDKPEKISAWLANRGNPYARIAIDEKSQTTLPLALSGVPETFVFDAKGVIVYNQKAPLTEDDVKDHLLPLLEKLHAR